MKVSREQVADNRRRILEAAGQLFREHGFEAVTVAQVMKAAGLTHGGFYGHFESKDALIAQALAHVRGSATPDKDFDLARYAAAYLSPRHRDDLAGGCPMAALGAETVRGTTQAREALTDSVRRQLERFAADAPGTKTQKRRTAIGAWSAMVGALVLARVSADPELADELLTQTQAFIRERLKPR